MYNQPDIFAAATSTFVIKKAKISKNILDKKALLLIQLPLYYDFYKQKSKNIYIKLA